MPLVPPVSATVETPGPVVLAGNPLVMSKALIQPPEMVAEHAFSTATKSMSAPPLPMLGLKNSVTGEHELDVLRSEEHTSELQSRLHLVCRLLLEKKKKKKNKQTKFKY